MRRIAIVLTAALAVACSSEEEANPESEAPQDVLMHDTLPDAATGTADTTGAFTVVLNEWTVRLSRDTIDVVSGPTVFRARNNGTYAHILEVEGQGSEWKTAEIQPGEWATLEVQLQPGTYEIYCPIDDEHGTHQEMGMTAELVVR